MNSLESLTSTPPMPTFACVRCSERKVKCDRKTPCDSCVRHNVECIFRPPKPSRRKRGLMKDKLVDERLQRYEALLREKGIDPNEAIAFSEPEQRRESTSSNAGKPEISWTLSPQSTIFKPKLVHGQSGTELVDNALWSRVAEEVEEVDSVADASDHGENNQDFAYVLGGDKYSTASSHPPPELIYQLWQTFTENVNPLTKLVHVPSLQAVIEKAVANIEHVPAGFEALMFAIYSTAVLSLTEAECTEMLGKSRAVMLPRYVAATKEALSRARFMSSTSIVVLQALLLHIISIRDDYEPRAVWTLTGVAIRVADGMGMRLDGNLLGLSPFETEIRRRIWWQITLHDFRAAELCGQAKFQMFRLDETTPGKPANVNDSSLYPTMLHAAVESTRPTEMMWCMFRTELASFAATQIARMRNIGKAAATSDEYATMDDVKLRDVFINELIDALEMKYLRFCDPSDPLQFFTLVAGRATINILRFMVHHPRRWATLDNVPASEQQLVWNIVIQLLERFEMQQSNPQLRRFAWNVPYFLNWPAVIHALDTLRAKPRHVEATKAWRLIDALYANNSEMLLNMKKPIFAAVGNLCLKAYAARETALEEGQTSLPNPPKYITQLRKQREAAKVRREVTIKRSKEHKSFAPDSKSTTADAKPHKTRPAQDVTSAEEAAAEALAPAQEQQDSTAVDTDQGITSTWDVDAFWLSGALDDGFVTDGAADMMNLDVDAILTQDYWHDNPGEAMDWDQWDAWLGNMEPARASIRE